MADIRSAAGEGSEPRVPAQAEPAHELAKLIAESDAKGKGFWRRLRKPKAGTTPAAPPEPKAGTAPAAEPTEPVEAPKPNTTDEPKPAMKAAPATPEDAPTSQPEATPDSEAKSDPEAGTEPEAKAASEAEAKAEPGSEPDSANPAEVVAEGNDSGTSEASEAEESADGTSEEAAAGDDSAGDAPTEEAATEASTDEAAAEKAESEESADAAAAEKAGESADDSEAEETADEAPAVDDPGAEDQKVEPGNEARSTVGVVYEPDESPDGFPLEYGDIIIGLPKPPETKKNQPKPTTNESAPQPQTDATEAKLEDAKPEPEQAEARADEAEAKQESAEPEADGAEVKQEGVEAAPEGADAESAKADAEPEKAEAEPEHAGAETEEAAAEAEVAEPEAEKAEAEPGHTEPEADEAEAMQEGADVASEGVDVESANAEREAEGEGAGPEGEAVVESADDAEAESGEDDAGDGAVEDQDARAQADDSDADSEQSDEATEESAAGDEQSSGEGSDEASDAGDQASDNAGEPASEASDAGDQPSDGDGERPSEASEDGDQSSATADEHADDEHRSEGVESDSADEPSSDDAGDKQSAEPAAGGEQAGEGGVVAAAEGEAEEVDAAAAAEKFATEQAAMALITALMRLRGALASSRLPIDVVGADEARQQQKSMLDQLDDYILPRLVQLEAPVLAVVGGSTGAGKSTLVNSLIGQVVSEPGVLRPTTRSPVLIHNPVDAEWFTGDRVLPGMARSSGENPGGMEDPGQIRLVAADTVPQGLAILDAPDIDSVVEANRELATQLLAAADLWLFVTTAARYADAVPWEFLQSASDRSTAVAVVLDRAPSDTIDDITGHLAQMLLERGLGDSPLFSIKETVVDGNGMLPPETVVSIKDWLIDLAADADGRTAVVRRTLHGAVTAMTKKTPAFATAVRAQADTVVELRSNAETAYERAVKDVAKATQDGTMLRGEVLARWQEFVGTGELLKGLQTNVGRMRDKMRTAVVGKPPPTRDLNDAVESGLESLLREHAEAAAERAEESWQSLAAGRQLLAAGDRDMGRMSKEFPAAAGRVVRDWQGYVLDLVRKEGAEKRSTARILAYGVNGLGLALMVVIFASTAGLTGTEIGVGAGTAVVGQKLLEAVFGDQAVRTLAAKAREDLDGRVHALMDAEFARYLEVLDQHPVDPDAPRRLTEAARAVEDCT